MNHSHSALPSMPESKNDGSGHGFSRRTRHIAAVLACVVSIGFWPVGSHSLWAQEPSVEADRTPSNQQDEDTSTLSEPEAPDTPEPEGPVKPVSYTHLRAHETPEHLVCRL